MSLEQLALLGIGIFAFIALVQAFNTARSIKRSSGKTVSGRYRRPVGSDQSARSMARSLVRECCERNEEQAREASESGRIPEQLEADLDEARRHFRERVEHRHRPIFNEAVDEIVLHKDPG